MRKKKKTKFPREVNISSKQLRGREKQKKKKRKRKRKPCDNKCNVELGVVIKSSECKHNKRLKLIKCQLKNNFANALNIKIVLSLSLSLFKSFTFSLLSSHYIVTEK